MSKGHISHALYRVIAYLKYIFTVDIKRQSSGAEQSVLCRFYTKGMRIAVIESGYIYLGYTVLAVKRIGGIAGIAFKQNTSGLGGICKHIRVTAVFFVESSGRLRNTFSAYGIAEIKLQCA